jgi:hypothetical protein
MLTFLQVLGLPGKNAFRKLTSKGKKGKRGNVGAIGKIGDRGRPGTYNNSLIPILQNDTIFFATFDLKEKTFSLHFLPNLS